MRTSQLAFITALLLLHAALPITQVHAALRASSLSHDASGSSASSTSDDDSISLASMINSTSTTPVVSVWREDDACSATFQRTGCIFAATCDVCLMRDGCAVESTTGKCVSVSRIDPALTGVEYFKSGETAYCAASDSACDACRKGDSNAPCIGAGGCVCTRQCEAQTSAAPLECLGALSLSKGVYFVFVLAVLGTVVVCIQARRLKLHVLLALCGRRPVGRLVQRHPRRNDEPHPLALNLDNWMKDRQDHKATFVNLELKNCFVQMDDADTKDRRARESASHVDSERETELGNGSFCSEVDGFEFVELPQTPTAPTEGAARSDAV